MICTTYPNVTVDGIQVPKCRVNIPNETHNVFDILERLKFKVYVAHEPMLTEVHFRAIAEKRRTIEEIVLSQRMIAAGAWYIDDFGFYVYCFSTVSEKDEVVDFRYISTPEEHDLFNWKMRPGVSANSAGLIHSVPAVDNSDEGIPT